MVSSLDVVVDDLPLVKLKELQTAKFRGSVTKVAARGAEKVYVPKPNQNVDVDYFAQQIQPVSQMAGVV